MIERPGVEVGVELEKPGEECGVFGVYSQDPNVDVAAMAIIAAHNMQHRGQEAAGVSVSNGQEIRRLVARGLASTVFADKEAVQELGEGHISSSHVRYGTIGEADPEKVAQPIGRRGFTVAHNGHWQSWVLDALGIENGPDTSDTGRVATYISQVHDKLGGSMEATLTEALPRLMPGAFALVITTKDQVFAIRDPNGFRPFILGKNQGYAVASETSPLRINGFEIQRDINPGEMLVIDEHGIRPTYPFVNHTAAERLCSLEFAYFTQPAGEIGGLEALQYRKGLGRAMAKQDMIRYPNLEIDIVTGIPDSGTPAGEGYAEVYKEYQGFTHATAFQKNRYSGRVFITPDSEERENAVRKKLAAYHSVVGGKRVLAIDDSIVRGVTSKAIVGILYDAGATEVHIRSSTAQYIAACYMGMDTDGPDQLLAAQHNGSLEAMRAEINATSLDFLDLSTMEKVLGPGDEEYLGAMAGKRTVGLCTSCMTGEYPIEIRPTSI